MSQSCSFGVQLAVGQITVPRAYGGRIQSFFYHLGDFRVYTALDKTRYRAVPLPDLLQFLRTFEVYLGDHLIKLSWIV